MSDANPTPTTDEQPSTDLDLDDAAVIQHVAEGVNANEDTDHVIDFGEIPNDARASILDAVDHLLSMERGGSLVEDERKTRREAVAWIDDSEVASKRVHERLDRLDDARTLTDLDDEHGLTLASLIEMVVVVPTLSPMFGPSDTRDQGLVAERIATTDELRGEVSRFLHTRGGQRSNIETDPCPFYGPTEFEILQRKQKRASTQRDLDREVGELFVEVADDFDALIDAMARHGQQKSAGPGRSFGTDLGNHASRFGDVADRMAGKIDDELDEEAIEEIDGLAEAIEARAGSAGRGGR